MNNNEYNTRELTEEVDIESDIEELESYIEGEERINKSEWNSYLSHLRSFHSQASKVEELIREKKVKINNGEEIKELDHEIRELFGHLTNVFEGIGYLRKNIEAECENLENLVEKNYRSAELTYMRLNYNNKWRMPREKEDGELTIREVSGESYQR